MSKTTDLAEKDARARLRAALDKETIHVRAGTWNGLDGAQVAVVGLLRDLHGTVCTCCPARARAVAS